MVIVVTTAGQEACCRSPFARVAAALPYFALVVLVIADNWNGAPWALAFPPVCSPLVRIEDPFVVQAGKHPVGICVFAVGSLWSDRHKRGRRRRNRYCRQSCRWWWSGVHVPDVASGSRIELEVTFCRTGGTIYIGRCIRSCRYWGDVAVDGRPFRDCTCLCLALFVECWSYRFKIQSVDAPHLPHGGACWRWS